MLNLVHPKVLAEVARHGSVTEAARELHYSQPSVSHHLSRLEAATGVKLVRREPAPETKFPSPIPWSLRPSGRPGAGKGLDVVAEPP